MKPIPFKENDRKITINLKLLLVLGLIVIVLMGITLYQSYGFFKLNEIQNFIQGYVGEFNSGDITLAVFVDGDKTNEFPDKVSGKTFERLECTKDGQAEWDAMKWKLSINEIGGPTACNVYFSTGTLLMEQIKTDVTTKDQMKSGNPNFAGISSNADTGMHTMADDYGTSYYFRGTKALLDNNVIFAGFQWKIIRINGDGSIRLIYNGICPNNSCIINDLGAPTSVSPTAFNSKTNEMIHTWYIYDGGTSSVIKTANETWYRNNLTSYDNFIADTLFCGDRTIISTSPSYQFGAYGRLVSNPSPILTCPQELDKYTKSTGTISQKLGEKVGLINADELAVAGGRINIVNTTFYLFTNQSYWSISPFMFGMGVPYCGALSVSFGIYNENVTTSSLNLRPVINLKSSTKILGGNGSATTPYIVNNNLD